MQSQGDKEFHDPVLKKAVCRCWSCDCAPVELKKKIAQLLDESAGEAEQRRNVLGRFSWAIWPVGLAACLLIGFAVFHQFQTASQPATIASVFPVSLENDLISRHDRCCKESDHQHLPVPKNDDSAIAAELHTRLNQPVLVAHPQDPDWQFRGAAVCPVGTTPSGHLVFAKGSDALSIFSLPKSLIPSATEGSEYAINLDGHSIVAFVKDGALFCLVSSGPTGGVTVDQLKEMESDMRSAVSRGDSPPSSPVQLTELLRPIGQ